MKQFTLKSLSQFDDEPCRLTVKRREKVVRRLAAIASSQAKPWRFAIHSRAQFLQITAGNNDYFSTKSDQQLRQFSLVTNKLIFKMRHSQINW